MCLAIPGKIIEIKEDMATVDYETQKRQINITLVEVKVGDYIIANAGFAIRKMDAEEAEKSIALFKEME